jgi:hypothetical protein
MNDDPEIEEFIRRVLVQRLVYLKLVKQLAQGVDDSEISDLERQINTSGTTSGSKDNLVLSDVLDLQIRLAAVDFHTSGHHDGAEALKVLLHRRGPISVRMRSEPNHNRAHFHVKYRRQYTASYAVDTLDRLAGYMPRENERSIMEWASQYQGSMAVTWQHLKEGRSVEGLVLADEGD